jgi:hypothetical protein
LENVLGNYIYKLQNFEFPTVTKLYFGFDWMDGGCERLERVDDRERERERRLFGADWGQVYSRG